MEKNNEIYEALKADFTAAAYSKDSSRGFDLTSLKAQYVKERLNEVLGIFGWNFIEDFTQTDKGIICHGQLIIKYKDQERIIMATGGSAYKKIQADAYKSAATDSLSKAASFVGVGNEVFKGHVNLNEIIEDNIEDHIDVKPAMQNTSASCTTGENGITHTNSKSKYNLTEPQLNRLYAKVSAAGWGVEEAKQTLRIVYGAESSRNLNWRQYDELCAALDRKVTAKEFIDSAVPFGS